MKTPARAIALSLFAAMIAFASPAAAARRIVALFPPDLLASAGDNVLSPAVPVVEKAIRETLGERFEVRTPSLPETGVTDLAKRRKARSIGAEYLVVAAISRIGQGVTIDVTLAPVEDLGKSRTVVVSGSLEGAPALSERYVSLFRGLGTNAGRRLIRLFFGAGAEGKGAGAVSAIEGIRGRSTSLPGEVVSAAMSDLDRDGRMEICAASWNDILVYRLEGDDLREKAKIPDAGPGLFHVDARDVDRDGIAEIVAVRFLGRKAVSDIWRFDGTRGYRKVASDVPYLLRTADLGSEGIVLLGQESDPERIYRGPIYRMSLDPATGAVSIRDPERPLPLPKGIFLLAFTPLRYQKEIRYAVLSSRDRLVYLDSAGTEVWEGLDAFTGTEVPLPGTSHKIHIPGRMIPVDRNQDGIDELVVMNVLVAAGVFFENLRIADQAEMVCYFQDGDSLQLAWRSSHSGAPAQDLLLDRSGGNLLRFGLVSRDRGKILGGAAQWRVLWMR